MDTTLVDSVWNGIQKNPTRDACVPTFRRGEYSTEGRDRLWGATVHRLNPPRPVTAWLLSTDPLMSIAGDMGRATMVRDCEFALQKRGTEEIRGKRKLTKKAVGEAFSAEKLTGDQLKVICGVLYEIHGVHTLCYNTEKKEMWFYPDDVRTWSGGRPILWMDARCEHSLEWVDTEPAIGLWLSEREAEGWKIPWPEADGTFEELKTYVSQEGITVQSGELGGKLKKADYAKCIGRVQSVRHLSTMIKGVADGYLE